MRSAEFEALLDLSAAIGADPGRMRGIGGSTSIKEGDRLWITASSLPLAQARQRELMVPIALEPLLRALESEDDVRDLREHNHAGACTPDRPKPSIDAALHALMPNRVVVHVHCLETMATTVQANAEAIAAERLATIPHVFVPYARPGLPLARSAAARLQDDTCVLLLGNHGLVAAAETVAEVRVLLDAVADRLRVAPRTGAPADRDALLRLAFNSHYCLPDEDRLHRTATDFESCRIAAAGSLHPDHVIHLGRGVTIAAPDDTAATIEQRCRTSAIPLPPLLLFPGKGVLVLKGIAAGPLAMAGCLAEIAARVPAGARLRYLDRAEEAALLGCDADRARHEVNYEGQVLQ